MCLGMLDHHHQQHQQPVKGKNIQYDHERCSVECRCGSRYACYKFSRSQRVNGVWSGSFIAENVVDRLKCIVYPLEPNLIVEVENQERVNANRICPNCDLVIEGRHFYVDLIHFKFGELDVILGMDWLSNHDTQIECKNKKVKLRAKDGAEVIFRGKKQERKFLTAIQMTRLLRQECEAYLAHVKDVEKESIRIEDIPVIKDFPDVFLDELPKLPLDREIEFTIDLAPGTELVSGAPYRMMPVEMKELATQLQELLNK
ncbi:uncharacterized protein LOC141704909 [Apium graveolens]|uniref:uncharacterized protein LOC141704909 n=1 Tax=Apium graveolens TaxID=4045 RepID=UPI003D7B3991